MKAVMKVAQGIGNVELQEIAEPEVKPGQAVIEVKAEQAICGTDLHIYKDEYGSNPASGFGA